MKVLDQSRDSTCCRYMYLAGRLPIYLIASLALYSKAQAELPPEPQIFIDTPVRIDPARPLKIGQEFYPVESVKLSE